MTVKQQKAIKKVKGFSSAYPNMCNLKLLPNVDGTWITIRDDVGTLMTVKLSDLNDYVHYVLEDLPSDTPKEKTGYWIDDKFGSKCSRCGMYTHLDKFDRPVKFKYCSMCGAKMHKSDVVKQRSKIDKAIEEIKDSAFPQVIEYGEYVGEDSRVYKVVRLDKVLEILERNVGDEVNGEHEPIE